ncbi:hypothetical protein CEUSTIGMA_g1223.t1 [Chlamydomonas eustigma]|uniref:Flap endonuclease 1 n=1 Tax=Chlamydomonas eustigma TaxID=1157962 RepID=A0A250WSZ0_9CHLO|nr:hypothetical protein CEUSTIGMA_g1223.t1 [Chlamydomonas eustigma]|eukprot:GAX73772.1 hypothetical protein CEUSTIGMA_g1223.t1 [Chlamydomonas eustigma]
MVAVGRVGDQMLTNESGETTSHLQGMFYRTVRMLEAGLQPVYVFDGKPPELKKATLEGRKEKKDEAIDALQAAKEAGDAEAIEKYSKRSVKVTREHNEECMKLLRLMGVPVVEAPSEAEAQCSVMAKAGLVYGVATEDMDALTFGSPRLLRHLMASSSQQLNVAEFELSKALEGANLTMDQFIDVCILCGCDYVNNIRGIGPVRAMQLIQKHNNIEAVLEHLDSSKYPLPEPFPYKEAREAFKNPEVTPADQLPVFKWNAPDVDGVVDFLVREKSFNEDRVRKAMKRVVDNRGKSGQSRMESFFQVLPKPGPPPGKKVGSGLKRKEANGSAATKSGVAKKGHVLIQCGVFPTQIYNFFSVAVII